MLAGLGQPVAMHLGRREPSMHTNALKKILSGPKLKYKVRLSTYFRHFFVRKKTKP
jgi:hypothetical protein